MGSRACDGSNSNHCINLKNQYFQSPTRVFIFAIELRLVFKQTRVILTYNTKYMNADASYI